MEGRIEKHTLSSGQAIERRETNTIRFLKGRERRLKPPCMRFQTAKSI